MQKTASASLLRTFISLLLFIGVDYLIFKSWTAVLLLVSIVFIHESGHFIAMKIFGYKGINMTFIPFVGAYVSGESSHYSKYKKIIVLLAGPVPGIVLGMLLLFLYKQNFNEHIYWAAISFLLLNSFNLLPVCPLDGGQIIETLFFNGSQLIQILFLLFSLVATICFLIALKTWFLIFIAVLILLRIASVWLIYTVRKVLDKKNIPYEFSYDELTDEQYAQIRDVLVINSRLLSRKFAPGEASANEGELIPYIEKILMPPYYTDLSGPQKIFIVVVYLFAFILPLLQWESLNSIP